MALKNEVKQQQAMPAVSIRTTTSISNLPATIGQSYEAIGKHLVENGVHPCGAPFAIYYNMDINDLDVEMGFPVSSKISEKGKIKNSVIPQGKVLSFTHVGPYTNLESAYNEAFEWIKANNIETSGIVCEFYPNDPAVTPPAELITEICMYLKD